MSKGVRGLQPEGAKNFSLVKENALHNRPSKSSTINNWTIDKLKNRLCVLPKTFIYDKTCKIQFNEVEDLVLEN